MWREDQRILAAQKLGEVVELARGEPGQTVQAVRVDDQRHLGLEQARDHRDRRRVDPHTGADQGHGALLGKRRDGVARLFRKASVLPARQTDHGNLEHVGLDNTRDGGGHGQGHIAGACASRGLGGHHGGSGIAGRSAHHEHRPAGELVDRRRGRLDDLDIVLEVRPPGHRIGLTRETLGLLRERRDDDGAAGVTACIGQQAGLEREHGDRHVGNHTGAGREARLGGKAARDIGRHHAGAGIVDHINPDAEGGADLPAEARAEHRIDYDVGLGEKGLELIARRGDHHTHALLAGALRHDAGQIAMDGVDLHRRDDGHAHAALHEGLGRDPAVAAVVAEAGQDGDLLHVGHPEHLMGEGRSRTVHQLGDADPHARERVLYLPYVLDVEHWLHFSLLLRTIRDARTRAVSS